MSFSSAERFEARQEKDVSLVKEVGRAVRQIRDEIEQEMKTSGTWTLQQRDIMNDWVQRLDSALLTLRNLGRREQQEITDFLVGEF